MQLTTDDRLAIHELVSLHGHLMDSGDFERLHELFTADVEYDLTAYGQGIVRGIDAIVSAARTLGDANPVAHHVTNIVITEVKGSLVATISKGIGIRSDGSCGSVVYHDDIRKEAAGWRIARRRLAPRRQPLRP